MARRIVLVGGGHTHLHVIRKWGERPIRTAELALVSPFERVVYSGMLPGALAGQYRPEEMEIDLRDLCEWAGVRLVLDRAVALDRQDSSFELHSGERLTFDIASIGIGSIPALPEGIERLHGCVPVKPISTFLDRCRERLDSATVLSRTGPRPTMPIEATVVGGGAAGFEIACCLHRHLSAQSIPFRMTLIHAGEAILPGASPRIVQMAHSVLTEKGIALRCGRPVVHAEPRAGHGALILSDGSELRTDLCLLATQAVPPTELARFELPQSERGFLAVHPTLQSTSNRPVFAVGDTAEIVAQPVPKAGVYAVREGPILWRNLQRMAAGAPLAKYRPQRRFLSLMNTGDGRAILQYHRVSCNNRWAWWWKDWIDRRFVRQHRPR